MRNKHLWILAGVVFLVAALAIIFMWQGGAFSERETFADFGINLLTEAIFLATAVYLIDRLLKRHEAQTLRPARYAAYVELRELYMLLRLTWARMISNGLTPQEVGGSVSGDRIRDIIGPTIFTVQATDIASRLMLDSFVADHPNHTWNDHLSYVHSNILKTIERCFDRHASVLEPELVRFLHDIERCIFVKAIDRNKENIHADLRGEVFGYGGESFTSFFQLMDKFLDILEKISKELELTASDAVPSRDFTQDLGMISGDFLARMMVSFPIGGLFNTYSPEVTYRSLIQDCIKSSQKYVILFFFLYLSNSLQEEIDVSDDNQNPDRETVPMLQIVSVAAKPAINSRNFSDTVRHISESWTHVLVVPFSINDVLYPNMREMEVKVSEVRQSILSGQQPPGSLFAADGSLYEFQ